MSHELEAMRQAVQQELADARLRAEAAEALNADLEEENERLRARVARLEDQLDEEGKKEEPERKMTEWGIDRGVAMLDPRLDAEYYYEAFMRELAAAEFKKKPKSRHIKLSPKKGPPEQQIPYTPPMRRKEGYAFQVELELDSLNEVFRVGLFAPGYEKRVQLIEVREVIHMRTDRMPGHIADYVHKMLRYMDHPAQRETETIVNIADKIVEQMIAEI